MSVKPLKTPETKGGDFEQVPAGVYLARCYQMVDLGTQTITSKQFGTSQKRQIMLFFELLQDEDGKKVTMEDGRPFGISQIYTWSMHKKAKLRADLNAWRGKPFTDKEANGFEITKLLDKFVKLQVVHNESGDKTYANIGALMATKKTDKGVNDLLAFSIDDPDMEAYEGFSKWLQEKIASAEEWDEDPSNIAEEDKEVEIEDTDNTIDTSDVPF